MANGNEHRVVSGAAATVAASLYAYKKVKTEYAFLYPIGGVLGGIVGGKLPDIIDRPDTPNHRSFAHSVALVGFSVWTEKETVFFQNILTELQVIAEELNNKGEIFLAVCCHFIAAFIIGLVAGYGAHLALDTCGARKLPLLCKQI
jgi:membrane-bound metal-dependent hydrolase YbcI (DUF457 family)